MPDAHEREIATRIITGAPATDQEFALLNRRISGSFKRAPLPKSIIATVYHDLITNHQAAPDAHFERLLKVRPIRTLSGVAPVTLLTKPFPCPGRCVYCPTEPNMPKSYLSNEPAAMRAVFNRFHPGHQIATRLATYAVNQHASGKIEIIILGGTWSAYPHSYQQWFIHSCYQSCNQFYHAPSATPFTPEHASPLNASKLERKEHLKRARDSYVPPPETTISDNDLLQEQMINETARHRIVGLCLETRPDWIKRDEIAQMRHFGATRIQLGIQSIYDDVLDLIKRGHRVEKAIWATRVLKDAGFKVDHHYMPNLPGSTPERDLAMMRTVFENPDFRPDQIKIYPTVVNEYAELKQWHHDGRWKPYTDDELIELAINIKQLVPPYVRINRLIRDIPGESILAGNTVTNLRQEIHRIMRQRGLACRCIRCREARGSTVNPNSVRIFTEKYTSSGGWEYFISAENADRAILYAFVRLRIPSQFFHQGRFGAYRSSYPHDQLPELSNAALIRELHTYGQLVPVSSEKTDAVQHQGLGKRLMTEAEQIVASLGIPRIAVISGVGVRDYYRKLGYRLEGTYMTKKC